MLNTLLCIFATLTVNAHIAGLYACVCLQEGKEYLLKSVGLWLPAQKQIAASSSTEEDTQVSYGGAWCFF